MKTQVGVIRSLKSRKGKEYNSKKEKKKTNSRWQNNTYKTEDLANEPPWKTEDWPRYSGM